MLSPDEYGLFRERIRVTDKKINPGLTKLLWSSMGSSKVFIRDGLVHVDEVPTHTSTLTAASARSSDTERVWRNDV